MNDRREVPERRQMDVIGNVFKKNWKWLAISIFALGSAWALLQAQLSSHSDSIRNLDADSKACHDFIVAQSVINKKIDSMDGKLDRLLRRSSGD